ncbi:MAG: twin-arginine translocase subunit TatC [Ktedonobacteraceae bacterium]
MSSNRLDEQDLLETMFAPGEDDENDPSAMSLVDHLEELRRRIFKSLIAIVVGTIVAFIFRDQIVHFLELPLPKEAADTLGHGNKLIVTGITEGFSVFLLVSVAAGFILALPVVLYQTWAFIAPGMLEKEKKYSVPFIVAGIVLFVIGVSLGFIVLRYPVEWLVTFASGSFTELVTAGSYFTFVAFFMLAFGLIFELPLVLTFMAQVDLISSRTLIRKRAGAHVGLWIASTFLTPGADIYSPIFLGVSMSFLYELSIIFIKITKK